MPGSVATARQIRDGVAWICGTMSSAPRQIVSDFAAPKDDFASGEELRGCLLRLLAAAHDDRGLADFHSGNDSPMENAVAKHGIGQVPVDTSLARSGIAIPIAAIRGLDSKLVRSTGKRLEPEAIGGRGPIVFEPPRFSRAQEADLMPAPFEPRQRGNQGLGGAILKLFR